MCKKYESSKFNHLFILMVEFGSSPLMTVLHKFFALRSMSKIFEKGKAK